MRKYLLGCMALGASFALVACGGSSSSDIGGGGTSGIALADVPAKLASTYCDLYAKCYGPVWSMFLPGEDCVTRTQKSIEDGSFSELQGEIDAGKVVYHADKAQGCLDALAARSCDQLLQRDTPACDATVEGTVDTGGDCSIDADCKGQAYCKAGGACPGKCAPLASAGTDCQSDEQCQSGLSCDNNTKKCVKPAAKGQACQGGSEPDCAPALICLGNDNSKGQTGTCMDPNDVFVSKAGQSCDILNFKWCENGDPCVVQSVGTGGTLVATCGQKVASGAACKVAVPDQCPTGEYCNAPPNTIDGTCTPLPKQGQACAGSGSDACGAYLRCDPASTTCKPLQRLGEACTDDMFCYSGHCASGGCAPPGCKQ